MARPLDEAVSAHAAAKLATEEAKRLLSEAIARERAEVEAETRAKVGERLALLAEHAAKADTHLAAYLGAISAATKLETEARTIIATELGGQVGSGHESALSVRLARTDGQLRLMAA